MGNGGGEVARVRTLEFTPTWSVAAVLTVFVFISFLVERSIHRLGHWLHETKRKALYEALQKMKEELMLLGFISLLLTAASNGISRVCIKSSFYESIFLPCRPEISNNYQDQRHDLHFFHFSTRRYLTAVGDVRCQKDYEPFISFEGMEQLHRFIFVMAVTHVFYSCLTMLLASMKVYGWRKWEAKAHGDGTERIEVVTRDLTIRRQSTFVTYHTSSAWSTNCFFVWLVCFVRQFGQSVTRADYLALRLGFIMKHNLGMNFDFHSYMIRSMEEEFKEVVGISAALWGFVVGFMIFNINGFNLYFWISFIPVGMVVIVGMKLQHIIASLAIENVGLTLTSGANVKPRNELFWFSKPGLLLWLIHFTLFQNSFELATFFWFLWQFGYSSCFLKKHTLVYLRLILGFAGQFLCCYSTLPLYALVTQMGTNYKVSIIPEKIRESINGWRKSAKRKRKHNGKKETCIDSDPLNACIEMEDEMGDEMEESYIRKKRELFDLEMHMYSKNSKTKEPQLMQVQRSTSSTCSYEKGSSQYKIQDKYFRSISEPVYPLTK